MRVRKPVIAVAVVALALTVGYAGEAPEAPKPTPEHQALGQFVGQWEGKGEMKPGPYGPGGPMSWTESCSWFGGSEFHVVCKSEGTGPMGPTKGLGIMGYDPAHGVYTHYGVDTSGWTGHAKGKREDGTWTFNSKETMGDKTFHSRFMMTMESPTRMTFVWQMSEDGETWTTMMEGTTEKKDS